jgi:hypothetical protein
VYAKPPVAVVSATDTTTLMSDVCVADSVALVSVDVPLYVTVIPAAGATVVVTLNEEPAPPAFFTQMYPLAELPCAMLFQVIAVGVSLYDICVEQIGCELGGLKVIPCQLWNNVTVPVLLTESWVAAYPI